MIFLPKSGIRQRCPLLTLLFNLIVDILVRSIDKKKDIKDTQIRKEEVKLPLYVDDMINIENSEDFI